MSSPYKVGAIVHMLPHDLVFAADLWRVAGAVIVRASGPVLHGSRVCWPRTSQVCRENPPTHELSDNLAEEFWKPEIGVFVVPEDKLKVLGAES
jgi:hypothetical protein